MYTAIDKNKNINIDSSGRLLDSRLRRITPEVDQKGYLFFYIGTEKRYVHVEVLRHHGDPAAQSTSPREILPAMVSFIDNDKTNTEVSNLLYDPKASQQPISDDLGQDLDQDRPEGSLSAIVSEHDSAQNTVLETDPSKTDVLEEAGDLTHEQVEYLEKNPTLAPPDNSHDDAPAETDKPVDFTVINGIGATIKDRLHAHGILTMQDFVSADPVYLGAQIKMLPARLQKLQEKASEEFA